MDAKMGRSGVTKMESLSFCFLSGVGGKEVVERTGGVCFVLVSLVPALFSSLPSFVVVAVVGTGVTVWSTVL